MIQNTQKRTVHRGRVFPEIQWSPEEKAKRKAENKEGVLSLVRSTN